MLVRYMRRLRGQPQAVRSTHAFFIASAFTAVVLLLWLTTLPGRLEPVSLATEGAEGERPVGSFFHRAREQVAALLPGAKSTEGTVATTSSSTGGVTPLPTAIELSAEDLETARAAAAMPYQPPSTTTPRIVRIVTSSSTPTTTATSGSTTSTP